MPAVEVDAATFEQLAFASRIAKVDIPTVIRRLVTEQSVPPEVPGLLPPHPSIPIQGEWTVTCKYKRILTEGMYNPESERLTVTSGPLAGQNFDSASAAAIAVVREANPTRRFPNTNGRSFWFKQPERQSLQEILGKSR